ncbi:MAG: hypothetical protein E7013_03815 [Alphaproteobacteria bacterium]|nr:hypothetical protein [Alphaproteobacteria bacterium]
MDLYDLYSYTPKKTVLEQFDDRLDELYFKGLVDIRRLNDEDIKKKNFQSICRFISKYQSASLQERLIIENQISYCLYSTKDIANYYYEYHGQKKDLAMIALDEKAPRIAAMIINGETKEAKRIRENQEKENNILGERDFEDDDKKEQEAYQSKTQQQTEILYLIYAAKSPQFHFAQKDDLASMFYQECNIHPHQKISITMEDGQTFSTTPFMYFLQKHSQDDEKLDYPKNVHSSFYQNADFCFENFEGYNLMFCFFRANQIKQTNASLEIQQKQQKEKEMLIQTKEEKENSKPVIEQIDLFTPPVAPKKPVIEEPKKIGTHSKVECVQMLLPGFERE